MSIIIYGAERNCAHQNDDNRRMLSARYMYVGLFTQKSPSFYREQRPRSFYASPKMESRRRRAKIYFAARRDLVFVGGKKKRKKWKERQRSYIFSGKSNAREDARSDKKRVFSLSLSFSSLRASCETCESSSSCRWNRPRQVHRDTPACAFERCARLHVRSVTHAHIWEGKTDEYVLETQALSFPGNYGWMREEKVTWAKERYREDDTHRGRKPSACFFMRELLFSTVTLPRHLSFCISSFLSLSRSPLLFTLLNIPFLAKCIKATWKLAIIYIKHFFSILFLIIV